MPRRKSRKRVEQNVESRIEQKVVKKSKRQKKNVDDVVAIPLSVCNDALAELAKNFGNCSIKDIDDYVDDTDGEIEKKPYSLHSLDLGDSFSSVFADRKSRLLDLIKSDMAKYMRWRVPSEPWNECYYYIGSEKLEVIAGIPVDGFCHFLIDDDFDTLLNAIKTEEIHIFAESWPNGELLLFLHIDNATVSVFKDFSLPYDFSVPIGYMSRVHFDQPVCLVTYGNNENLWIPIVKLIQCYLHRKHIIDAFPVSRDIAPVLRSYYEYEGNNKEGVESLVLEGRGTHSFSGMHGMSGDEPYVCHSARVRSSIAIHTFDSPFEYDIKRSGSDDLDSDVLGQIFDEYGGRFISVRLGLNGLVSVVAMSELVGDKFTSMDQQYYGLGSIFEGAIYKNEALLNAHGEAAEYVKIVDNGKSRRESKDTLLYGNSVFTTNCVNIAYGKKSSIFNFYVDSANKLLRFLHPVYIPYVDYDLAASYANVSPDSSCAVDFPMMYIFSKFFAKYDDMQSMESVQGREYMKKLLFMFLGVSLVCHPDTAYPAPRYMVLGFGLNKCSCPNGSDGHPFYDSYINADTGIMSDAKSIYNEDTMASRMWNSYFHGVKYVGVINLIARCYADSSQYEYVWRSSKAHLLYTDMDRAFVNAVENRDYDDESRRVTYDYEARVFYVMTRIAKDLVIHDCKSVKNDKNAVTLENEIFNGQFDISFNEMYDYVRSRVIGHDDVIKSACFYVWSYLRSLAYDSTPIRNNFIITGASGCGKTEFMRALRGFFEKKGYGDKIPVDKLDIASVTASGYKGINFEQAMGMILGNSKCSQKGVGIVFLDELDKKLLGGAGKSHNDYFDNGVQYSLLTALEGCDFTIMKPGDRERSERIDTRYTLFIGLGTFDSIRKRKESDSSSRIGFTTNTNGDFVDYWSEITKQDVVDLGGGKEELLGRFTDILNFKPLDDVALRKILYKNVEDLYTSKNSSFVDSITIRPKAEKKLIDMGKGKRGVRSMIGELSSTLNKCLMNVASTDSCDKVSGITIVDIDKVKVDTSKKNKNVSDSDDVSSHSD